MMSSKAETFAALHRPGDPLLLPNAWDVGSAVAIAAAGARAIATTSAGMAWSLGFADGADLGADRVAAAVERIAAAVGLPVSADIEAGYDSVEATVTAVVQAGAVGVNIEDRVAGVMLDPAEQAERLAAARAAADRLGVRVWINARTDVYLAGSGRLDEVKRRAEAYAAAGADSVFVPGLVDLAALAELSAGPLPVAAMAWAGAPGVAEFASSGVARVSLGSAIAQAAYALAARATTELLEKGGYDATGDGLPYDKMNALYK
ncbi:isocitrate lyase/phosphoenolpyruvate mutase family protein [Nonomuraea sp. NPDC055795]